MRQSKSQKARVLDLLRERGPAGISALDFIRQPTADGGKPVLRLAARLWDLRMDGHEIRSISRSTVERYVLVCEAGQRGGSEAPPEPEERSAPVGKNATQPAAVRHEENTMSYCTWTDEELAARCAHFGVQVGRAEADVACAMDDGHMEIEEIVAVTGHDTQQVERSFARLVEWGLIEPTEDAEGR